MAGEAFGFKIETARFQAFTQKLADGLDPEQQEKMLRALGLKFIGEVVGGDPATPVDTGRARAGWAALADAEGMPLNIGGDGTGIAKGRTEGSFEVAKSKSAAGLRIRNAVPYIQHLEYGSSDQAPAGFVRIALRKMRTGVRGRALETLRQKIAEANVAARLVNVKAGR